MALIKSIFDLKGSITIPPCTKKVVWRFLDLPIHISIKQLERIQLLIKNQKDESCKPNKVADSNGNANRPKENITTQKIFCCTSENWKFLRVKDDVSEWTGKLMHFE